MTEEILKEQEARLTTGTLPSPCKTQPAAEVNERQPVQLPDGTQPEPRSVRETQSRPTLDEQQKALLTFISEHPDTPVSSLYKELGVSVWKGNEIRDSLKAKGLITEVEVRTGKTTAGRPPKFFLLTFQAYTLFGIEPPTGRGGVLHRHIQHMIRDGATAKGYTAKLEKVLENGAIVDVHLEKPGKKIAIEIAVLSTPEREISHIRNCLAAGYYVQVFTIFCDPHLLARTATAITASFSGEEAEKVRLLPLSQLPQVG
jgi:hypothetical protein